MPVNIGRIVSRAALAGALVVNFSFSAVTFSAAAEPVLAAPAPESTTRTIESAPAEIQTRNFLICGASPAVAKRIGDRAEKRRKEIAKLWLGKELNDWGKPARLELRLNQERPSGATTFDFKQPADAWAPVKIHLAGNLDYILANSLPHEVTHAVLADHFRKPVPRWADEGTAILSESDELHRIYDGLTQNLYRAGKLIQLDAFFDMQNYPASIEVLYAEGFSTTRFLVNRKDRATFVAFLKTGMQENWAIAAKRHYDFESLDDLQTAWLSTIRPANQK